MAQKLIRSQSGETKRIERSELRVSEASKNARTACLHKRTSENEHFEVEEGFLYKAGIAD